MHRLLLVLFVVAVATVLAGCEVAVRVDIDVTDDGSGTVGVVVELDAEAVATVEQTGGALEDQIRLDDLAAVGWAPTWARTDEGGAVVRMEKDFARPEDLAGVIGELSGSSGPLRDVTLVREAGLLADDYTLTGVADLATLDAGILDDPELVAALGGTGVDPAELEARLAARLREALVLEVGVTLPGAGLRLIGVEPGEVSDLTTTSTDRDWSRILFGSAAMVLATAAVVVLAAARHNRRHGART